MFQNCCNIQKIVFEKKHSGFYQTLLPLLKARGHTIFAISHDDGYFRLADRLLLIRQGELRELFGEERETASRDAVEKLKR